MSQAKSLTLRKYGKQPVIGKDNSQRNQMRPFFEQQIGMLEEAYEYSSNLLKVVYDKAQMEKLMQDIRAFRDGWLASNISTLDNIRDQIKIFNGFLGRAKALCSPRGASQFIHERNEPFSLWNVEQRYAKSPKRIRVAFTDGLISRSYVRVFTSPYRVGGAPVWTQITPQFVDSSMLKIVHPGFEVVVVRETPLLTNTEIDKIDNAEESIEAMRRIHHCTMEIGFLMSRISSQAASESGVVEKIVYRDRIVEVPKEVIKEVVKEVPVEKIVEKIVYVSDGTGTTEVPERFPRLTNIVWWSDIAAQTNIMQISRTPREKVPNSGTGILTKKGSNGRALPAESVKFPAQIDANRIVLAWAYRAPDANTDNFPMWPVAIQGATIGAGNVINFSIESATVNPVNWKWTDMPAVSSAGGSPGTGGTSPTPNPPPPPPPPTTSNSATLLRKAIAGIGKGNEVRYIGWGSNNEGAPGIQGQGGAIGMGGAGKFADAEGGEFAQCRGGKMFDGAYNCDGSQPGAKYRALRNRTFDTIAPWGVLVVGHGNNVSRPRVNLRRLRVYCLYKGENTWRLMYQNDNRPFSWRGVYLSNMITHRGDLYGQLDNIASPAGYQVEGLPFNHEHNNHGGLGNLPIPQGIDLNRVEGYLMTIEGRIDPGSRGAVVGLQMGLDPKFNGDENQPDAGWYPNIFLSKIHRFSDDWQEFAVVNARTQIGSNEPNGDAQRGGVVLSTERILGTTVPGLSGASTGGGSTQPAPPPPTQPPVSNTNRCSPTTRRGNRDYSLKSLIAENSTGNNEGPVKGWDGRIAGAQSNGSSGQGGGSAVVMGNMMRLTWNDGWFLDPWREWASNNGRDPNANVSWAISQRFNFFQSWGVFMEMQDNRENDENMWAEVRNNSIWVLYRGRDTYERVAFDQLSQQTWCEHFAPNMGTTLAYGAEFPPGSKRYHRLPMDSRPVAGGGVAYRVRPGFPWAVPHFAGASTRWTRPDDIESILIAYEARLAPGSEHAKIGMHIGADPKINGSNDADRTVWYPGFGVSKVMRLTPDWRLYAFTPMQRQNGSVRDGNPARAVPWNRFMNACLPLGDTYSQTVNASGIPSAPSGSPPASSPPAGSPPSQPPAQGSTFAALGSAMRNVIWVTQTPAQSGENVWKIRFIGIRNGGQVINDDEVRNISELMNDRQWVGSRTFPAIVWTGGKELPENIGQYKRKTFTVDRANVRTVEPWHEVGIWHEHATMNDRSESTT